MKKSGKMSRKSRIFKNIIKTFFTVLLIISLSCVMLFLAFVRYADGIDAKIDAGELFSEQGLTTKLYFTNEAGASVELESQRLYGLENRIFIGMENIPQHVCDAFVAIEDHRFWEHDGIDLYRTGGAVLNFIIPSGGSFGGSTITQQLIKNLTGEDQVTVRRKLTEILRAVELERSVPKNRILELYLNTVYLSQGCYGIETASEKYFGKSASDLTVAEGASLAAIIRYPTRYDPLVNPENNVGRRNIILARMNELGYLSDELYRSAVQSELELKITRQEKKGAKNTWFTDCVIEQVIKDLCEKKGLSRSAASDLIYGGGLTIYTTMDAQMQEMLEAFYLDPSNFPRSNGGESPQSSAVIMDKNGAVKAIVGGRGEKNSDRILCLATGMPRSPGSVIKPVSVYAPALDGGLITWASVFDDVPVTFTKTGSGYSMWPKNNPRIYAGLTTVNQAIKISTNTVSVRVLEKFGYENSFAFLRDKAGISTLVERRKSENGTYLSDIAPAPLALGATSDGVSLLEMTAAYSMFSNGGICSRAHFYTNVYDKNGTLLLSHDGEGVQAISSDSADIMTRMMQNVTDAGGTASCITLKNRTEVAGKTGTSNSNTDRWFIGYTPNLLCGVWYGFKDARDIGYYKANPAAQIFDGVMAKALTFVPSDEYETKFTHSPNVVSCLYCKDSGLLPSKACLLDPRGHRVEVGYFLRGTEPTKRCDVHMEVNICPEGGVVIGKCKESPRVSALIHPYNRSFPCQVRVTDAQFVYRRLPAEKEPSNGIGEAFFECLRGAGEFFGTSGVTVPFNRVCPHYYKKDEPDENEFEDGTTSETTANYAESTSGAP